jgi:hypothetical protein
MLQPPSQQPPQSADDKTPKRSEAVFVTDSLRETAGRWTRILTFWYEGEDYQYALEALGTVPGFHSPMTEPEARRKLCGPNVIDDVRKVFLQEVALDMTRPH